jgi:hypothetical protein
MAKPRSKAAQAPAEPPPPGFEELARAMLAADLAAFYVGTGTAQVTDKVEAIGSLYRRAQELRARIIASPEYLEVNRVAWELIKEHQK